VQMRQIWVPPTATTISAIVDKPSTRTVAHRHRVTAYHINHSDELLRVTNINDYERP